MASGAIRQALTGTVEVTEEIAVQFDAGTVGTRGYQKKLNVAAPTGKKLIGTAILYISDSSKFVPFLFTTGSDLYCNIYRATPNAVSGVSVNVRFVFANY